MKERSASPAADRRALILWVVFNQLIGNADAHAKNLAILYSPAGPRLAPFYDLLCTRVYSDLSDRLAMRIGGENRPAWIQPRHWERFSADVGIKPGLIRRIVEEMSEKMAPAADSLANDFASTYGETMVVEKIVRSMKKFISRQKVQE